MNLILDSMDSLIFSILHFRVCLKPNNKILTPTIIFDGVGSVDSRWLFLSL